MEPNKQPNQMVDSPQAPVGNNTAVSMPVPGVTELVPEAQAMLAKKPESQGPKLTKWVLLLVALLLLSGIGYAFSHLVGSNTPLQPASRTTVLSSDQLPKTAQYALPSSELSVTDAAISDLATGNLQVTSNANIQGNLTVTGNGSFGGTVTASQLIGNGSNVTNVNATLLDGHPGSYYSGLATGVTAAEASISSLAANAALLNAPNTFSAANDFTAGIAASSLNLGAPLSVASGGTGLSSVPATGVLYGTGSGTLGVAVSGSAGQCLVSGVSTAVWQACPGGGAGVVSVDTLGGVLTLANSSGAGSTVTINDASTAQKGIAEFNPADFSTAAGVVNTIQGIATTSAPTFAGLTLGSALTVPNGGTGANTLAANGVIVGNGAGALSSLTTVTAGDCLVSTAGAPSWTVCPGSGGVASVNNATGALTVADAAAAGTIITIQDASTAQKGIAEFNSTNFQAAAGIINTIQNINAAAAPTFGQLSLTSSQAAAEMLTVNNTNAAATGNLINLKLNGNSEFSVAPSGNTTVTGTLTSGLVNGQNISAAAAFTGTLGVSGLASLNNGATVTGTLTSNSLSPTGALTVGAAGQQFTLQGNAASGITASGGGFTTTVDFVGTPTASQTYQFDRTAAAGTYTICTTAGNCSGVGGGVTTPGGTANKLAKFTAGQTIGNSSITDTGSSVSITPASDNASVFQVQNAAGRSLLNVDTSGNKVTLGNITASAGQAVAGELVLGDGTADNFGVTFSPATLTANQTITIPNAAGTMAVAASGPIALSANGTISCATCLTSGGGGGSAGVSSVDFLTGALILANSTGGGTTVTINNAKADGSTKGIATFNATDFKDNSAGLIDTAQGIATTSSPSFAQLTAASSQATAEMLVANNTNAGASGNLLDLQLNGNPVFTVSPAGNVASGTINGQTISSSANFTGTLAVGTTLTTNTISPTGALTVGATAQQFTLQGNASSTVTATGGGFATTVGFAGSPVGAVTYNFDRTAAAGTYTICTTVGNCAGSGTGVTTAGGAVGDIPVFTASQAIGDSLLSQAGSVVTIAGSVNLTGGNNYEIGGTQISSANLSNDSNLAKLNATQTFTGGTNTFKNAADSTDEFSIQDAGSAPIFQVDSTNGRVGIGGAPTSGELQVFGTTQVGYVNSLGAFGVKNGNQVNEFGVDTVNHDVDVNSPDNATGSTTLVNSDELLFQNSYWNGSAPASSIYTIQNVALSTAPTYELAFNNGSNTVLSLQGTGAATFENATNSSNAFEIQNASGHNLVNVDTSGGVTTFGNITSSAGQAIAGTLDLADGTADNFGATVNTTTLTANRTITIPDASGQICLTSGNCTGVGGSIGGGGIANQLAKFTGASTIAASTISDTASSVVISPSADSATGFQVQNASGSSMLNVDALDNQVTAAQSSTAAFGDTSSGATPLTGVYWDGGSGEQGLTAQAFTTTTGGTISALSAYIGAGGISATNKLYQMAVYSDNAGAPGTYLGSTGIGTIGSAGWNSLPITLTLQPRTNYWLVYWTNVTDSTNNGVNYTNTPAPTSNGYAWNTFETWQCSSGCGASTNGLPDTYPTAGDSVTYNLVTSIYATFANTDPALYTDSTGTIINGTALFQTPADTAAALLVNDADNQTVLQVNTIDDNVGINTQPDGNYSLNVRDGHNGNGGGIGIEGNSSQTLHVVDGQNAGVFDINTVDDQIYSADLSVGDLSANLTSAGLLVSDNFESGNFGLWTDGSSGGATIDTSQYHDGRYSAEINVAASTGYARTGFSSSSTSLTANMWFRYHSLPGSGELPILTLYQASSPTNQVQLYITSGGYLGVINGSTDLGATVHINNDSWTPIALTINQATGEITIHQGQGIWNVAGDYPGLTIGSGWDTAQIGTSTPSSGQYWIDEFSLAPGIVASQDSSLTIQDTLHASGSATFGGSVLVQPASNTTNAFQVQNASGGSVFNVDTTNGIVGTAATTTASTNSQPFDLQSGNATGTTSSSGNVSLESGASTGNSGAITIQSGNSSGGAAGDVIIDTGTGSTTAGGNLEHDTFEGGVDGWGVSWSTSGTTTSTNYAEAGTHSLTFTTTAANWGEASGWPGPTVTPGNLYTFSVWVRSTIAGTIKLLAVWQNGTPGDTVVATNVPDSTTGWTKISGAATAPPGTTSVTMTVDGTTGNGDVVYVDEAMINGGSSTPFVSIGASNAGGVIIGNNSAVGSTIIQGGTGGIDLTTAAANSINIGTDDGSIVTLGDLTGVEPLTLQGTGISDVISGSATAPSDILQTTNNSATAFQIQNATSSPVFTVDTTGTSNNVLTVVNTTSNNNASLLTLNNSDGSAGIQISTGGTAGGGANAQDTYLGYQSGQHNALNTGLHQGQYNTGVGYQALQGNNSLTGSYNTAVGYEALEGAPGAALSGNYNTAVGNGTEQTDTTGYQNSALGDGALSANQVGYNNTALGYYALNATGITGVANSGNTAIGVGALDQNTDGSNNTALGVQAGDGNPNAQNFDGNDNTFIGYQAGYNDINGFMTPDSLQNSTAIGYQAQVQASNALILGGVGTDQVNVGIGTTIPESELAVSPIVYSGGDASVTSIGTTITGTNTNWTSALVGDQFIFETGQTGIITAVTSQTSLTVATTQAVIGTPIPISYRIQGPGLEVSSTGNAGLGMIPTVPSAAQLQVTGATSDAASAALQVSNSTGANVANFLDDGSVDLGGSSSTQTRGYDTQGTSTGSNFHDMMSAQEITTGSAGGTLSSISTYIGFVDAAPDNIGQLGIYADNGSGAPGNYLASSAPFALKDHTWNTVPMTSTVKLAASTHYWLTYWTNVVNTGQDNNQIYSPGGGTWDYNNSSPSVIFSFSGMPTTFPAATTGSFSFSIYATMQTTGAAEQIVGSNGSAIFQNTSNSTSAFTIQNAGSNNLLTADTTNMRVGVNANYMQMGVPTISGVTPGNGGANSLTASTQYYYKVTAVDDAGGESTPSAESSGTTTGSNKTLTVAWSAVTGATAYRVYRSTTSGSETYLGASSTTSYVDDGTFPAASATPPSSNTAYTASNVASSNLALAVGGVGTPNGQLYVSGLLPTSPVGSFGNGVYFNGKMAVVGNYAYIALYGSNTFDVLDVSNPASPTLVSSTSLGVANPNNVVVSGKYAYVTGNNNTGYNFQIVDIEDANHPTVVSHLDIAGSQETGPLVIQGRYAFLEWNDNASNDYIASIDISNPSSPSILNNYHLTTSLIPVGNDGMQLDGKYLYVALDQTSGTVLQVFDVSNPAAPNPIGSLAAGTATSGVYQPFALTISGRYVFISSSNTPKTGQVVDISDPTNPTVTTATFTDGSGPVDSLIQGDRLYVLDYNVATIQVSDITNPLDPIYLGVMASAGNGQSIIAQGHYLYTDGYAIAPAAFIVYDLGGISTQSINAGTTQTADLTVTGNEQDTGNLSIQGGTTTNQLDVQGDTGVGGNLSVFGDFVDKANTASQTAFSVQSATASVLDVDTVNNRVGIDTSAPTAPLTVEGPDTTSLNFATVIQNSASQAIAKFRDDGAVDLGQSSANSFGDSTVESTLDSGSSAVVTADRFITPNAGAAVTSMSIYVGSIDPTPADDDFKLGIYADNGGAPGAFVAGSAQGTLIANSWNTIAVSASLSGSTYYWLAYITNGTASGYNDPVYTASSSPTHAYLSNTYTSGFPGTMSGATLNDFYHSIYATTSNGYVAGLTVGANGNVGVGTGDAIPPAANLTVQTQANTSTAFQVQNASSNPVFTVATNSGTATIGNVTSTGGAGVQGALRFADGTADNYSLTLQTATPLTGNDVITLPDATGTVCLSTGNCASAGPKSVTKIVAMGSTACSTPASTASGDVAAADYTASSCSAQTAIQAAINSLTNGGVVYLEEGTYILSGGITLPSNVTLEGAGASTILEYENAYNGAGAFMISLTSTSSNKVVIENLALNGNKANQSSGSMYGLYLSSNATPGVAVNNVWADNFYGDGIEFNSPGTLSNCEASGNVLFGGGYGIVDLENDTSITNCVSNGNTYGYQIDANDVTVTGSSAVSNSSYGFETIGLGGTLTGDIADDNGNDGFFLAAEYSTISGSTSTRNSGLGILLESNNQTASGNTVGGSSGATCATGFSLYGNQGHGIEVSSNNDIVSGNTICLANGNYSGVYVDSNNDTVTDNQIMGGGGSGYAIYLFYLASQTYLSGNTFSGTGATSIGDIGNGNIYSGQATANNDLALQGTGAVDIGTTAQGTATLTVNGGINTIQLATPSWSTYGGVNATGGSGTTWGYEITALDGTGETVASTQQTDSGGTPLSGTVYNTVLFPYEPGAVSYNIYRTATGGGSPSSTGLVTTITSGTLAATNGTATNDAGLADYIQWKDTGFAAGTAAPTANTTGGAILTGPTTIKPGANTTTAFQVQNASAVAFLTVDTTNERVVIGPSGGDTVGAILVLGNKTNAGDPTGVAGAMYYNSAAGRFRCYENGEWKNCIGIDPDDQRISPFYSTDFISSSSTDPWYAGSSPAASDGTFQHDAGTADHPGIMSLEYAANAPANSGYWVGDMSIDGTTGYTGMRLAGGENFQVIFNPKTITNITTELGFIDNNTGTASTNGVYMSIAGATLTGTASAAGTSTNTGTTDTLVAGDWYRATVTLNSNATLATFTVYNLTASTNWTDTVSTNIPTANDTGNGITSIYTATSTSNVQLVDVDYMALWYSGRTLNR